MVSKTFRLSLDDWAALQDMAAAQQRTASGQLRLLIKQALASPDRDAA